jgi:glycine cleavage system aminomethyltransferase T
VHVTPVTTAYASMHVAGPKSRELLERVTEGVALSAEAFPYMRVRTGRVAVSCALYSSASGGATRRRPRVSFPSVIGPF